MSGEECIALFSGHLHSMGLPEQHHPIRINDNDILVAKTVYKMINPVHVGIRESNLPIIWTGTIDDALFSGHHSLSL